MRKLKRFRVTLSFAVDCSWLSAFSVCPFDWQLYMGPYSCQFGPFMASYLDLANIPQELIEERDK